MNIVRLFVASLSLVSLALVVGCESESTGFDHPHDPSLKAPLGVAVPCEGGEIHSRSKQRECVDGKYAEVAHDLWCCLDGTQRSTKGVISESSESCGGSVAQDPTAKAPPPPPCTVAPDSPPQVAGGILVQHFTSSPGGCRVTAVPTVTPGRCTVANPEGIQANVRCLDVAEPGTYSVAWTCSRCPDGSPDGAGTYTGTW